MENTKKEVHYVYILECSDKTLYTGWTTQLEKRIDTHNAGKGAKYTKPRLPVHLCYYECFASKSEALRRECAIKKLSREQKQKLIAKGGTEDAKKKKETS